MSIPRSEKLRLGKKTGTELHTFWNQFRCIIGTRSEPNCTAEILGAATMELTDIEEMNFGQFLNYLLEIGQRPKIRV
jgi:hypothetical protein